MELLTVNVVRLIELQLFNVVVLLPRIGGLQGVLGKQRRHVLGVHFQSNALLNPQRVRNRDSNRETEREGEKDILENGYKDEANCKFVSLR